MKSLLVLAVAFLIGLNSCCDPDKHFYTPEGTLSYYSEIDTLKYLSSKTNEISILPLCKKEDFQHWVEYRDRCDYKEIFHWDQYLFHWDSCSSDYHMLLRISPTWRVVMSLYSQDINGQFSGSYNTQTKRDITILGKKYENVISIDVHYVDLLDAVLFSPQYGIIQMVIKDDTLNLYNDEIY